MYNNKLILDYTNQVSQKKIYRTTKAMNLTNSLLQQFNRQNLDSIKKQLNFDNHDTFSQERNHKNAKTNRFIGFHRDFENIAIQLNFD